MKKIYLFLTITLTLATTLLLTTSISYAMPSSDVMSHGQVYEYKGDDYNFQYQLGLTLSGVQQSRQNLYNEIDSQFRLTNDYETHSYEVSISESTFYVSLFEDNNKYTNYKIVPNFSNDFEYDFPVWASETLSEYMYSTWETLLNYFALFVPAMGYSETYLYEYYLPSKIFHKNFIFYKNLDEYMYSTSYDDMDFLRIETDMQNLSFYQEKLGPDYRHRIVSALTELFIYIAENNFMIISYPENSLIGGMNMGQINNLIENDLKSLDVKNAEKSGWVKGFNSGQEFGYDNGRKDGYKSGYNIGYDKGFNSQNLFSGLTSVIFGAITGIGDIEILPNVKIAYIAGLVLVLGVIYFIIGRKKGD